ncbi:LysR family transcriptional regulator [Qingshengfaniella alkalisoli]|uniref:LysR family transcriptional regulator n=1 Tax=Qingshengfaniella alkalisoli TaxID=2599296 RepID=A0A5B8IZ81_9RHOB|nr:LysR family transcriptional regulator [Qingshengfaniella alkalisoli]QDY69918.1 LysR family transcriptional regulator [Qingshengfaniella alkalisoli]
MDRLSELEVFTTVVDQGGFTGAAKKLGVSKSAVSKHVASLENRLGAKLLNRTTRRVNPTELGEIYYDRALTVLDVANDANRAIADLKGPPSGLLRIAVTPDFGSELLSRLLVEFLTKFSSISVDLIETADFGSLLAEGFDVAVRVGAQPDSVLRSTKLAALRYDLVASPAYLGRRGSPDRIEALFDHDLLHPSRSNTTPGWQLVSSTGESRSIRSKARISANDPTVLRDAALAGHGIAFLPQFLIRDALKDGSLKMVLPELPQQLQPVHAVQPPGRATSPKVQALLSFLRGAVRDAPG